MSSAVRKPSRDVSRNAPSSSAGGANAAPCTTKSSPPNSVPSRSNTALMSSSDVTSHGSTSGGCGSSPASFFT